MRAHFRGKRVCARLRRTCGAARDCRAAGLSVDHPPTPQLRRWRHPGLSPSLAIARRSSATRALAGARPQRPRRAGAAVRERSRSASTIALFRTNSGAQQNRGGLRCWLRRRGARADLRADRGRDAAWAAAGEARAPWAPRDVARGFLDRSLTFGRRVNAPLANLVIDVARTLRCSSFPR